MRRVEMIVWREVDVIYRYNCLGAEARDQALRLTATRESFILREYVSQQLYANCCSLDEVGAAIARRRADQDPRVVRLRELTGRR